jgi:hypothetical protein
VGGKLDFAIGIKKNFFIKKHATGWTGINVRNSVLVKKKKKTSVSNVLAPSL